MGKEKSLSGLKKRRRSKNPPSKVTSWGVFLLKCCGTKYQSTHQSLGPVYQAKNTSPFQLIGEMDNGCRRAPKGCHLQRGLRALISDCIDRCSSTTKTEDRNLEGDISAGWISAASYKSAE
ncbi:hypothetical protein CEXT_198121 [Caerostris extrusa]|uniref:Uncharacterized protein n=1 Tax=Caerostris extrusa TaxID=172846 RepID=A0AAV4NAA4_CAEEX|nr:hypothetical protein CEXT_198121 [Caerostris extrusa]